MQEQAETLLVTRSTFVTVVAWIFIVLAGLSTLMAVLQNAMLYTMGAFNQLPPSSGQGAEQMPSFLRFMLEHMYLLFVLFLIVSATTLAAAVGLLRRKNWARLLFVGILALGIAWNLGGIAFQQVIFSSMSGHSSNMPSQDRADFDQMASTMTVYTTVFAVGMSILFAWLIKRLLSRPVGAEFNERSNHLVKRTA